MDENILKELVKSRKILKRKFESIKLDESNKSYELENTFKPLSEPLKTLVKLSSQNISRPVQSNSAYISNNLKRKYDDDLHTSTPKMKNIKQENLKYTSQKHNKTDDREYDDDNDDNVNDEEDNNNDTLYDLSYLERNKKLDKVYGPHRDENGVWKLGNADLKIKNEKIIMGNQNWDYMN